MKNEDLISFVKYILNKYSVTPDEWDAFVDVTFRVNPYKGSDTAKIMMPCVYQKAICTKHK